MLIADNLPVFLADGLGVINVVPLNVVPRTFVFDDHQSSDVLALRFREDLGLNSFLTDDSNT